MSKNCLVTKLKATVDNNSLITMNELRFSLSQSSQGSFGLMSLPGKPFVIKVVSGNLTLNGQTSVTIPYNNGANTSVSVAGTSGVLSIDNKYNVGRMTLGQNATVKLADILHLTEMLSFSCTLDGDAGKKPNWSAITSLILHGNKTAGQLSDLLYNVPNKQLRGFTMNTNAALKGSMSDISVKTANINNLPINLASCTGITGTVADYVSVKRTQGETSGSMKLQYIPRNYIKANDNTEIPAGNDVTVTWSADNKITLQGSSQTIEIDG